MLVSGGELFMVNKSSPSKQAAAWKFLKFLDEPDSLTDLGDRHRLPADPQGGGRQRGDAGVLGAEPDATRSRTTSSLSGPNNVATSGLGDRQLHRRP